MAVATSSLVGLLLNLLMEAFLLWILKTVSQQSKVMDIERKYFVSESLGIKGAKPIY